MKCQCLFSGKNNKKYFNMSSAENFTQVLRVKGDTSPYFRIFQIKGTCIVKICDKIDVENPI